MASSTPSDLALLEALILDNPDLERLENLLDQFNIIEALGAVRAEVRHSDFLAFLLNPRQNHWLEDAFVKRLLQNAVARAETKPPITPIDLDVLDLDELVVSREWQHVDILLLDESNRLAVIIENKVDSGEHSDQLRRYRESFARNYPDFRLLCLFLTPDGETPSDSHYISIDYGLVAGIVEALVESRATVLGPDVRTLMSHYGQMLRRHVVSDSDIAELCRKIYRKHQRALDLIYEYRPDKQADIQLFLEDLIRAEPDLTLDHSSKSRIRFVPVLWNTPLMLQGKGQAPSGRLLFLEFVNEPERLNLNMLIGPGPVETRQKLLEMAKSQRIFKSGLKELNKSFNTIYARNWLKPADYEDASTDDLEAKIKENWKQFLAYDLPLIQQIVLAQDWIWAEAGSVSATGVDAE